MTPTIKGKTLQQLQEELKKEANRELNDSLGPLRIMGEDDVYEFVAKYIDKAIGIMSEDEFQHGRSHGTEDERTKIIKIISKGFGPQGYDGNFEFAGDGGPLLKEEIINSINNL
jgi:hypothetical protein